MRTIHVVGAAIVQAGRCLVAQRGPNQNLAGKWEFPGGKVEPGESPDVALAREIQEELGLEILVGQKLGRGVVTSSASQVVLDVYRAAVLAGEIDLREHAQTRWVSAAELDGFDWAEADVPIVAPVASWLRSLSRSVQP
jgi:8-oxo-dGTP diphosphatase